jgi:hypothetical protein
MELIPSHTSTIRDMREFLSTLGVTHTFRSKKEYQDRLQYIKNIFTFPWRIDQRVVIETFLSQHKKYYVVNGIFGCGKTSMIMGIHVQAIVSGLYKPTEAMFLSFNVCIKNELIQKLRSYGMSAKTDVRTFDSIIYEICKKYDYPYMDLPNYEGKRKFVYKICSEIKVSERPLLELSVNPRFIFIDECQDLEHQTFNVFHTFFPASQIIFTGDVFQSIQKEPRESLLWYLLHNNENNEIAENISRHYMKETPRVPIKMLENVKNSLKTYYPEFTPEIDQWHSSSLDSTSEIEWHRFYNYTELYKKMDEFVNTHDPEKSMILTFSSAITVKGAMGDLARVRRYLVNKGIDVNHNHKKMDHDKLFLSTVNSSKGLERDYVFIISTFPLERAFVNFSHDLVVNLITVGVTRSKQKVIFYVPAYDDKFSKTLEHFAECPRPNAAKIREGKVMGDFTFDDYLHIEHSVTELIKQSIIKYDTRIRLREYVKKFDTTFLFEQRIPAPKISTEEERSFVGVLLENLITSGWAMQWPKIDGIEMLRNHPMYAHCFKKIEDRYKTYNEYVRNNTCTGHTQFMGIYYYSQIHVAMYNKLFIEFREETRNYLSSYWNGIKNKMKEIQPAEGHITIQTNMRMPWVTGVADAIITSKVKAENGRNAGNEQDQITVWELKASIDANWADDALIQAMLYAMMSGKSWARIVLLNPFRNEKLSYYFNMKNIMEIRNWVIDDVMTWNANCYLSKQVKAKGSRLDVTNNLFLTRSKNQYTLFQFMSPTKLDILLNVFITNPTEKKRSSLTMLEKLCNDSIINEKDGLDQLIKLLETPSCRDKKVYYTGISLQDLYDTKDPRFLNIDDITGDIDLLDEMDLRNDDTAIAVHLDERPVKNDAKEVGRKYQADYANTLAFSLTMCSYLAKQYKLV